MNDWMNEWIVICKRKKKLSAGYGREVEATEGRCVTDSSIMSTIAASSTLFSTLCSCVILLLASPLFPLFPIHTSSDDCTNLLNIPSLNLLPICFFFFSETKQTCWFIRGSKRTQVRHQKRHTHSPGQPEHTKAWCYSCKVLELSPCIINQFRKISQKFKLKW